jgi:hypothetical protein
LFNAFRFGRILIMSRQRDTQYAAKRRAAARRRTREIGRHIFAYSIIGLLILGTVSFIFVPGTISTPVDATPTPANSALSDLVSRGDQEIAAGSYSQGISYYMAYSIQNPQDADVLFKLGKAFVNPSNPQPDYLTGVNYLQRAVNANANASWAAEAYALISQYNDQAIAGATATAAGAITGTNAVTDTVPTSGAQPTAPLTGTNPITP